MLPELEQSHQAISSSIFTLATILHYTSVTMEFTTTGMLNEGMLRPAFGAAVEHEALSSIPELT
jgi:hypothetical protein